MMTEHTSRNKLKSGWIDQSRNSMARLAGQMHQLRPSIFVYKSIE